ncbi:IclR family transcriptional regulator [Microvirga puerhi]|uniref:IclR family transcriptional regulator n=1 Tax=Microvirga puerhi TaxID=2876078 RepID=A0ABS7VT40_9HYPH|nr:IclR family transcriptional regulator [Microvirga puerhi]MBZ6078719.1 IclR family transcriptional regulator [Microvirga puerhi]
MPSSKSQTETSVLKRVSDILNLFSEDSPTITLADVEAVLNVSQATAYRYLHDLHEIGLLSRTSGRYAPGPTTMELEYIVSNFDPILLAAKEPMKELSETLGLHVLLCRMYKDRLVNVYYSRPEHSREMPLRPGRRLPLFRGAQARVVLAELDRRKQRRIFERAKANPDRDKIGTDWASFSATLQKNRRDGYYMSCGEIDEGLVGIAAPVFDENAEIMGAISLSYPVQEPPPASEERLIELAKQTANEITQRVAQLAGANGNATAR